MPRKTIKSALIDMLEDLRENQLKKFRSQLLDRREEPRVRCSAVENKGIFDITDVLVSTFTEAGALKVCLEILREIGCNEEADRLDSRTKACEDMGNPIFCRNPKGELVTEVASRRQQAGGRCVMVKKPEEVEAEAKARVVSEGGDPGNIMLVLSRYTIQFGQYRGQTFKWLLENDMRYTAHLVASHQKERERTACQSPLMANKDALTRYSCAYPDFVKEVRFHRALEEAKVRSLPSGQEGESLVGFGKYRSETLQSLYESKDEDKISYVNYLRRMTGDPGTKMEAANKYIWSRDQAGTAAAAADMMAATASTRPARKTTSVAPRTASKKLAPTTSVNPPAASRKLPPTTSVAPRAASKTLAPTNSMAPLQPARNWCQQPAWPPVQPARKWWPPPAWPPPAASKKLAPTTSVPPPAASKKSASKKSASEKLVSCAAGLHI